MLVQLYSIKHTAYRTPVAICNLLTKQDSKKIPFSRLFTFFSYKTCLTTFRALRVIDMTLQAEVNVSLSTFSVLSFSEAYEVTVYASALLRCVCVCVCVCVLTPANPLYMYFYSNFCLRYRDILILRMDQLRWTFV